MQLNKLPYLIILQIIFPGFLKAQHNAAPVEISVKALMVKPVASSGYTSAFELSPQIQARIGSGRLALNTEFGTGNFSQNTIMDQYPALVKFSSQKGSPKWRNSYLALGPTYRFSADHLKTILVDVALMGGVAFNHSEAYSVEFKPEFDIKETLQNKPAIKKNLPIIKPSVSISKYWGNWGANIYGSWQKSVGEYSSTSIEKDLRKIDFTSDQGRIIKEIMAAPNLKINNKLPASLIQFGIGVNYSIGRKNYGENPKRAEANINTSRSNIKNQVSTKDSTGNTGNQPQPEKANINTSRSNKKQQINKKDSTGNTGNGGQPQPAEANINTSRSNIKNQVSTKDSIGNTGNQPQPAKANINTSRSNKKQQINKKDSTRNSDNSGQPQPAEANINTSRSNIKNQVSAKDSTGNTGNGGQPQPAEANINTSRSNIKNQVSAKDSTGNTGNPPQPAKANINTSRSNKKQQVSKVDSTGKPGNQPQPARANINTSRSNKKQQ